MIIFWSVSGYLVNVRWDACGKYLIIPITRRVKKYTRFVEKNVEDKRKPFWPYKYTKNYEKYILDQDH